MKKRYLFAICLIGAIALSGCGKNNTLMKASDAPTEVSNDDSSSGGDSGEEESKKDSNNETTEAYENVTRVVEKNVSEKLTDSVGDVTVVVGSLDGYARNFGSPALIQYLSTGKTFTDITYQLYEGCGIDQIKKLAETFANSKDYGNSIKEKIADYTYEDYTGFTLSYDNNGKTVYELILIKEVNSNCLLTITILQDNEKLDNDKISKLTTSAVSIATSKQESESSAESSEKKSEEATTEGESTTSEESAEQGEK